MTLEFILLLCVFVFVLMGPLIGGPKASFDKSAPRLGARVEKDLTTGDGFDATERGKVKWLVPPR